MYFHMHLFIQYIYSLRMHTLLQLRFYCIRISIYHYGNLFSSNITVNEGIWFLPNVMKVPDDEHL